MNLLRIQDALKNASDQQLVQLMQAPDTTAPSYLVLSEIRRRKDMRSKQEQEPETTVAEDLTAPPQTYADQDGIRSLRQPGYEEEARAAAGDNSGIEAMRAGGVVRMAQGDVVEGEDIPLPPEPPEGGPPARESGIGALRRGSGFQSQMPSYRESFQDVAGLFPDNSAQLRQQMRDLRVDPAARRNEAVNLALIEAGLRIAASKNPSLIGSIGEGAAPAVQSYAQQVGQIRQEQRAGLRDEMTLAKSEIERMYAIGQINASERRTMMQEIGADRRAATALAAQAATAGRMERIEQMRGERNERTQMALLDRQLQAQRERGDLSFTDFQALSPEQQRAYLDFRGRREPGADVSGLSQYLGSVERSLSDLDKQIDALGPRPSETTGMFNSRNPRFEEWTRQSTALQQRRDQLMSAQRDAQNMLLGQGRPRVRAGAGASAGAGVENDPLGIRQ